MKDLSKTLIVGVAGLPEAGKTTFARNLVLNVNNKTQFKSKYIEMSDAIQEVAYIMGWNGKKDEAGRKLLQSIGEMGREYIDKDIWIKKWEKNILNSEDHIDVAIVPGVRYQNEVDYINSKNGLCYRVVNTKAKDNVKEDILTHPVESQELDIQKIVENNSSIEEFKNVIEGISQLIISKVENK